MLISIKRTITLRAAVLVCALAAVQTSAQNSVQNSAQTAPQTSPRPDPLNADAPVPALSYQSAFAAHRSARDDGKLLSWREANDNVARIGGWRVYAREAQTPEALPVGTPVATPVAAPASTTATPATPATPVAVPAAPAKPSNTHQHHKP